MSDNEGSNTGRVTDYQFVKALEEYARVLLVRSMKPAAIAKRKVAAKAMIDHFAKDFDCTYTECQIFKKINNLKQRLRDKAHVQKKGKADSLLMKLLAQENVKVNYFTNDGDGDANDNDVDQITDLQFVKTLGECGRSLLSGSNMSQAKRQAAETMRNTFAEDFGIIYTENSIFKQFKRIRRGLQTMANRNRSRGVKSTLDKAETALLKLLEEENTKSNKLPPSFGIETDSYFPQIKRGNSTFSAESSRIPVNEEPEDSGPISDPFISFSSLNYNLYSPKIEQNPYAGGNGNELHQKVMAEHLNVFKMQMEVLDVQKEVYLLQKELLMAKLKARTSMKDDSSC